MDSKNVDVSIVIVNYKTPDLLKACVQSIVSQTRDLSYEIIIVDNHSEDESEYLIKSIYPEVRWINSGYNAGFARANNLGIRNASGDYVLLLNSDTIVNEKTIINTYNDYVALEKTGEKIGFLACQLIDLGGNIQFNSRQKFQNIQKIFLAHPIVILLFRFLRINAQNHEEIHRRLLALHQTFHQTKWLGGTFLFFNKKITEDRMNLLDEDFFMYGEDIEWSKRLLSKGYRHYFTANASVIHAEGGSFKIKAPKWIQIALSEWLFILKGYGKVIFFFVALVNLTGIQLDNFLLKRYIRKNPSLINDDLMTQYETSQHVADVLKRNFFKLLCKYHRKTSTSKDYLKYEKIEN